MKILKKNFSLSFSQEDSKNEQNENRPYHVFANTGLHNAIIKNTDPCVSLIFKVTVFEAQQIIYSTSHMPCGSYRC